MIRYEVDKDVLSGKWKVYAHVWKGKCWFCNGQGIDYHSKPEYDTFPEGVDIKLFHTWHFSMSRKARKKTKLKAEIKLKNSLDVKDLIRAREALVKAEIPQTTVVCDCWEIPKDNTPTNFISCKTGKPMGKTDVYKANGCGWYTRRIEFGNLSHSPQKKEKEDTMNYAINVTPYAAACVSAPQTDESKKREYLSDRLRTVYRNKRDDLPKAFGLEDDSRPKTAEEIVKRIQDGKFVLPKRSDDFDPEAYYHDFGDAMYGIEWRDPAVKKDKEGHKAALKALEAAYNEAKDTIMILSEKDGLEALKAFESATFH